MFDDIYTFNHTTLSQLLIISSIETTQIYHIIPFYNGLLFYSVYITV